MDYTLNLTFLGSNGEKISFSISDVKKDITGIEASALMDTMIEKNIFNNKNGSLVSKYSAQVTEKNVTKLVLS